MNTFRSLTTLLVILTTLLSTCADLIPTTEPQPPKEYLENALNWIQTYAVFGDDVDWDEVRREAFALAPDPQSTADTYPALRIVLARLGDGNAWLGEPPPPDPADDYIGLTFHLPENIVIYVDPNSPAEQAEVRVGDFIELINGEPPKPYGQNPSSIFLDIGTEPQVQLTLRRAGLAEPIQVVLDKTAPPENAFLQKPAGRQLRANTNWVGYLELPYYPGFPPTYPGQVHNLTRKLDRSEVCGWIFDLRRNHGGDIWSYLAAIGPILGEGNVGGFTYLDGAHELWGYHGGKVFWADNERAESLVEGGIYTPKRAMTPVALLAGPTTIAAGELVIVAFEGREKVRIFGEPTSGLPTLIYWTQLSDGAFINLSGAFSTDRSGKIYDGPILPDETVKTDWAQFGADQDSVILAALDWLKTQPDCSN